MFNKKHVMRFFDFYVDLEQCPYKALREKHIGTRAYNIIICLAIVIFMQMSSLHSRAYIHMEPAMP